MAKKTNTKFTRNQKIAIGVGIGLALIGLGYFMYKQRQKRLKINCESQGNVWDAENKVCIETERTEQEQKAQDDLTFKSASAIINSSSYPALNDFANYLKDNTNIKLLLIGHTDNEGTEESNQKLSEDRANSVKKYFVDKGISSDRINTEGRGETEPIASNDTKEGKAKNRRVVFITT